MSVPPGSPTPPWARQQGPSSAPPPVAPTPVLAAEPASSPQGPAEQPSQSNFWPVMLALAIGSLVTVAIGAYSGLHDPTGQAFNLAGFSSGLHAKSWLASLVFALTVVQLVSALAMWGRLPGISGGGRVTSVLHRWSGRLAVLVSLPVAAHCLYALGFQGFDTRVLVHSLLGCLLYGIFVCKMIVLTRHDSPGWVVPVAGGILFTTLTGLWLTSSLWFFTQFGLSF